MSFWQTLPRPFFVLAPMEDVTDTVFRRIVSRAGRPDVFFTEFTGADSLFTNARRSVEGRLRHTDEELPLVAQIWGNRPENYERAAREIRGMGFAGLDINMGCPIRKITRKGFCSALIENRSLAAELIAAAMQGAGDMPVSVKTRIGFSSIATEEWCGFLLTHGLAALTVHGRIAAQQSEGVADWNQVARVVSLRDSSGNDTMIIGNGDVADPRDLFERPDRYGVDGVMVGRGIFENLFIFGNARDAAVGRPFIPYSQIDPPAKIEYLRRHMELFRETWGARRNYEVLKKFVKTYVRGFTGDAEIVDAIMQTHDYDSAFVILDRATRRLSAPSGGSGRSTRRAGMPRPYRPPRRDTR